MATPAQATLAAPMHNNRQLFSDHYLNVTLLQRQDWLELATAAEPVVNKIKGVYGAYIPSDNEAQLEENVVRPVLRILGHNFEVQAPLATADGTKRPDYVLYQDVGTLAANKNKTLTDVLLRGSAFAVGDAKAWDRPLDKVQPHHGKGGDTLSNKNPSYQIAFYVQQSGVEWGILTNGRLWRLYHKDTAHKLDRYYEVDLPALLDSSNADNLLYFYAFFRRQAFESGPLSLASFLQASVTSAQAIGDTVKRQVYDALRHLAQGFLDYKGNDLTHDEATLKEIYDNALIVLYRLLFILYAEARDLLPVRESEQYRDTYSLQAMKEGIARNLDAGRLLLATSARLWPTLTDLFGIIDAGSPPLKVATFNGGLFDPERHPFLVRYVVGDAHLQQAIDKLTRVSKQFVDYRDLAERHLGTIYEGLLEYRLLPDDSEEGWTVVLLNDKGERHATGSYYTPDYIVKYMVDVTLRPLLHATVEGVESDADKIARVLAINVLDTAMGSGHFLVEATAYIARFLVSLGAQESESGGEADLAYWRRRVAQSCIYGVDLNPLAVDLAKLSLWLNTVAKDRPLSFLDHHLRTGNTLVGARISELRHSPTNASSSKRTAASRKTQRAITAGQLTFFSDDLFQQQIGKAVDSMARIESNPALTVADVKEQEKVYAALRRDLIGKYGTLADLETSTQFGLTIERPTLWPALTDYAAGRSPIGPPPKLRAELDRILSESHAIADERRFFYWDLEFPEVFFNQSGKPKGEGGGFDAIIGNPPYVRQETLAPYKPYFQHAYAETYDGVADLYVYFYQRGLELTHAGGRMSYIVTNKWMRAGYGEKLRAYFAAQGALESIVDFGHAPIFADADVFPCIVVLERPRSDTTDYGARQVAVTAVPREELSTIELGTYIRTHSHLVPQSRFTSRAWSLESSSVDDLLEKIRRVGVPLTEFVGVKPYYGIKTGLNEAFLIDTPTKERIVGADPRSAEIIKPYLRGQDVKRWAPEWQGLWMILLKSSGDHKWPWSGKPEAEAEHLFEQVYPSLYHHLKPLEDKLRVRQDKGRHWWELRSCAYYAVFEQPKIIHTDITWQPQFAFTAEPTYLLNTAYVWPTVDLYVLAAVNSPLLWSYMWREAMHGKDEALRLIYSFVETVPIAPPTDEIRAEVEPAVARLISIARANGEARDVTLDWLRTEFDVNTPGTRLEAFARLEADAFVNEVRKRRPKRVGSLTPAALKDLRVGYLEQATAIRQRHAEAGTLEGRIADLINVAYGLTPSEVDLLWSTAPPRMPGAQPHLIGADVNSLLT